MGSGSARMERAPPIRTTWLLTSAVENAAAFDLETQVAPVRRTMQVGGQETDAHPDSCQGQPSFLRKCPHSSKTVLAPRNPNGKRPQFARRHTTVMVTALASGWPNG
eukprot:1161551-Pelagomonas_calceolata.AAC.1